MYHVNLCGPSKDCFNETKISLTIETPLDVKTLKLELVAHANQEPAIVSRLLDSCALATDSEVLPASATVPENTELFLLPPVCGG